MGFPILEILGVGSKIIDRIIPDPQAKAAAQARLLELQMNGELATMTAQANINTAEAKSPNVFIAGWRPFIGWTCGAAFASNYVVAPLVMAVAAATGQYFEYPQLDLSEMMPVLLGMLGLGAYRTYEKHTKSEANR